MRYLEFSPKSILREVAENIVNQYRLVEAISDDDIQTILQRVNQELIREIGTNPKPSNLRSVLVSHGFKRDSINKILAGIDDSKSKGKTPAAAPAAEPEAQSDSEPEDDTTEKELKAATSAETPSAVKLPELNPDQKKQAEQAFSNLKNPYRGLSDEVGTPIRQSGEAALKALQDQGSEAGYKALKKHIDYINQLIADHKKSSSATKTEAVIETASGGSTGAGSVASVSAPLGAVIRRMPPGQSFFAPTAVRTRKKTSKKAKKR